MNSNYFISSLENSAKKIEHLLDGVSEKQAKWKPQPEKWSILEIVNHLYDEEKEDFRKRIDLTRHYQDREWPGIDPEGWVFGDSGQSLLNKICQSIIKDVCSTAGALEQGT